jgi:hypothetical protein
MIRAISVNPFALHIAYTQSEQAHGKAQKDYKINRKPQVTVLAYGGLQNVRSVSEWKNIGEGS